jgi:flagellar biosynthetic protein FliR
MLALFPMWPIPPSRDPSIVGLTWWALSEAGFGLAAGVTVSLLLEEFQIAAQIAGLQAGYGYASTIDPNSEADSSVLQVMASLSGGLLFFATGLDHQLIRALAASFSGFPAGVFPITLSASASVDEILRLGSAMLATGLRLALPVAGLLLLIDFALALVSRIQQQLQLHSLAFPGKMQPRCSFLPRSRRWFPRFLPRKPKGRWQRSGKAWEVEGPALHRGPPGGSEHRA